MNNSSRGKRGPEELLDYGMDDEDSENEAWLENKRAEAMDAAFFAGRGKKAADAMAEANFFAGRGKKSGRELERIADSASSAVEHS